MKHTGIVRSYIEFWSPDHHRRIDDLTGWSSPGKRLPFTMHAGFVVPLDMLDLARIRVEQFDIVVCNTKTRVGTGRKGHTRRYTSCLTHTLTNSGSQRSKRSTLVRPVSTLPTESGLGTQEIDPEMLITTSAKF